MTHTATAWPPFASRRMMRRKAMYMAAARRKRGGRGHGRHKGYWMGGYGGGQFFGGGPKVRRGDVRIAILALLAEEPMHGYQIIGEITERSGGAWKPSPGSVYPTLQQLEDEGLVRSEDRDGRKTYELTSEGSAYVDEHHEEVVAPWDQVRTADDSLIELRDVAFQLGAAVMQVARAGSDEQIERAKAILNDARSKIYRLLAEDDAATGDDQSQS